jgi:hypothetical protein
VATTLSSDRIARGKAEGSRFTPGQASNSALSDRLSSLSCQKAQALAG